MTSIGIFGDWRRRLAIGIAAVAMAEGDAYAGQQTYTLPADAAVALRRIWADNKDAYTNSLHTLRLTNSTAVLYNVEVLNYILEWAVRTDARDMIDGAAEMCLVAASHLNLATNYLFHYVPGYPSRALLPLVPAARIWAISTATLTNEENILNSSQFLYYTARTVTGIAGVPAGERTPMMVNALETLVPVIMDDHIARWVLSAQGVFQVKGWGGLTGIFNHRDFMAAKRDMILMGDSGPPYCNAIADTDMWIVASVVQMLAANALDPVAVPIAAGRKQELLDYVGIALQATEDRLTPSVLTNFYGEETVGLNFDAGLWATASDRAYSAYTNATYPTLDQTNADPNITWDISHARRFIPFFDTLYDHRDITGSAFPSALQMQRLAAQMAYSVFNRDANRPLFANYMNANGWYRVRYNDVEGFGYAPWALSSALTLSGYGFWSRYLGDFGVMMGDLDRMIASNASPNVAQSFCGAVPTNNGCAGTGGMVGQAIHFDGANGYAAFPVPLNVRTNGTIAFWIWPESATDQDVIHFSKTASHYLSVRRLASGALYVRILTNGTSKVILTSTAKVPLSQWSHVAITQDGGGVDIFVNGALSGVTGATGATSPYWMDHLRPARGLVGKGNLNKFTGVIDDLRLYGRALTAAEITACCINRTQTSPAPVAHWPFDVLPDPALNGFVQQNYGGSIKYGESDSYNMLAFLPCLGAWSPALPDEDDDEMPDAWELDHFESLDAADGGPQDDWDRDGMRNLDEWIAGTDPTSDLSLLTFTGTEVAPGSQFVVRWHSAAGKSYAIDSSTNLLEGFTPNFLSNIPATPYRNSVTVDVNQVNQQFFRVRVEP